MTAGQASVLDQLRLQWEMLEPGGSRLVVIHGRSGTGKTAIVHEFYRWLVARDDTDARSFWPPDIPPVDTPRHVARKAVQPCSPSHPDANAPVRLVGTGLSRRGG